MSSGLLGQIETPRGQDRPEPGSDWCADNGCFGKGFPGDDKWFAWLEKNAHRADDCVFAVAPDVVGDAAATWARSREWLPKIRALGYPAALVAQDGMEDMPIDWDAFDVLFIGGSTVWKLGPAVRAIVAEAKARGKHVHMGRVNSLARMQYAHAIGCDSADGTHIAFGPDLNLPHVLGWLRDVNHQGVLDFGGAA